LHVNVAGIHFEATDDRQLLVTNLVNRGKPLLRYEIGDLVRLDPEPCLCEDPCPVLASLEGRTLDVVVLPYDQCVLGLIPDVRWIQQDALGIEDARMVQNDLFALEVNWVAGPNFQCVDAIPVAPHGKVRPCLSRVPHDAVTTP
jgi:phenylacetate-CoA ligase